MAVIPEEKSQLATGPAAGVLPNLLMRATNFVNQIPDGWYLQTVERHGFPAKILQLRQHYTQWWALAGSTKFQFNMESTAHLKDLIEKATKLLSVEEDYIRRMERSLFPKMKRRAFPGKLAYILEHILAILDADPELLSTKVHRHQMMEKHTMQTPVLLPFEPDLKYVPMQECVSQVRAALEDAGGHRVITVYGGAGIGKSSLIKHVAHAYQVRRQMQACIATGDSIAENVHFPDGVYYLFCGKGAVHRVQQLQIELLFALGFTGIPKCGSHSPAGQSEEQVCAQIPFSFYANMLRRVLAYQTALIVLDDVWEEAVLSHLFTAASSSGVKYLVSSQNRDIWWDAIKVALPHPQKTEAKRILANYTEGLPEFQEIPKKMKKVIHEIMEKVEHHPHSLANVGISVSRSRATDPQQWEIVRQDIFDYLDVDDHDRESYSHFASGHKSPYAYHVSVGTSMMRMVDCLAPGPRNLLSLIAMLKGSKFPEPLITVFFNCLQPTRRGKFDKYIKYLENRSLLDFHPCQANTMNNFIPRYFLAVNSLLTHYVRERNVDFLRSLVLRILEEGDDDINNRLVSRKGKNFATVISAMFFRKSFRDMVAVRFHNLVKTMNMSSIIPRNISVEASARQMVENAHHDRFKIEEIIWLLDVDEGAGWKNFVYSSAKKVILRYICTQELHDDGMARLLRNTESALSALAALQTLYRYSFREGRKYDFYQVLQEGNTFLNANRKTMEALVHLTRAHCRDVKVEVQVAAIETLGMVFQYEKKSPVLTEMVREWMQTFAHDPHSDVQMAIIEALVALDMPHFAQIMDEVWPEFASFLGFIVDGLGGSRHHISKYTIDRLCQFPRYAGHILQYPNALKTMLSQPWFFGPCYVNGKGTLWNLSSLPGFSKVFAEIQDDLGDFTEWTESYSSLHVRFWGNVALSKHTRRATRFKLLRIASSWLRDLDLEECDFFDSTDCSHPVQETTRAVTIINSLHTDDDKLVIPFLSSSIQRFYACKGVADAHQDLGMHKEALQDLQVAHHHLRVCLQSQEKKVFRIDHKLQELWWRRQAMLSKVMLGDYSGAVALANEQLKTIKPWSRCSVIGERGALHRLAGQYTEALRDLNTALGCLDRREGSRQVFASVNTREHFSSKYCFLRERSFVKRAMGDALGSKADAERAAELECRMNPSSLDFAEYLSYMDSKFTPGECVRLGHPFFRRPDFSTSLTHSFVQMVIPD